MTEQLTLFTSTFKKRSRMKPALMRVLRDLGPGPSVGRVHKETGEGKAAGRDTLSLFSPPCSLGKHQALCCFLPQHLTGQRGNRPPTPWLHPDGTPGRPGSSSSLGSSAFCSQPPAVHSGVSLLLLLRLRLWEARVLICVPLFATTWTGASQAPLSMEFSRQEYWSGLPFPSPGYCPDPGIQPTSLASPVAADCLPAEPPGKTVEAFLDLTSSRLSSQTAENASVLYTKLA